MKFRILEQYDIPACVQLCRSAGWNQLSRDWEIFLKLDPRGSRVCIDDDEKVIGTVTTIRYDGRFAWIGMVLVDPLHRRKGIGRKLLEEANFILNDEACVKLDATPAGREVYIKLGFNDEYALSRMAAREIDHQHLSATRTTSRFACSDLPRIQTWDEQVFGANRTVLLSWMIDGAPDLAFKAEEENTINGYCFGRHGTQYTHIGPVVANDRDTARALVTAALNQCKHQPVILDVPDRDEDWLHWLGSVGFTLLRPFVRMYLGENRYPGTPSQQYAILGPEFG